MKKCISLLIALCLAVSLLPAVTFAAEGDLPAALWVEPSEANGLPVPIQVYKQSTSSSPWGGGGWGGFPGGGWGGWTPGGSSASSNSYGLFLPGNVSAEDCFLFWEDGLAASDGENSYVSGALPVPAPGEKKTYTFTKGSETKTFEVSCYQGSESVPPVFIEIDESLGTISAMNNDSDHETVCSGMMYIDGQELPISKMKGRGNSSWMQAVNKKPYNITLDKKVNLLGIDSDKTKKWSFLANTGERSLLRNQLGYDMAHAMGIGQDSAQADVWMNGKYLGVYLVTPKTDSFVSKDGFMVENDNYKEKSIAEGGDPSFDLDGLIGNGSSMAYYDYNRITVKKIGDNLLGGEENEETLTAATEIIRDYMQEAWDAIRSDDGYNTQGKYYADYVDMKSWACMYLMQELAQNYDFCGGSLFFHREGMGDQDKLYAGPIWDLDIGFGCPQNSPNFGSKVDQLSGCTWFIRNINGKKTSMYHEIGKHPDFMEEVTKQYNIYKNVFDSAPEHLAALAKELEASAVMDAAATKAEVAGVTDITRETVKDRGTPYEATYKATDTWNDYVDNLMTYVSVRTMFFSDELTTEQPDIGFAARFNCGKNSSVTVYDTQDVTGEGTTDPETALARNSETGEIDVSGDGQINFVVNLSNGYQISNVKVEPSGNYKNIKGPGETGVENCYRITKVTGPITVTVETQENICVHDFADGKCTKCGAEAFRVNFACTGCTVTVYPTQDLSEAGEADAQYAYARGSASGKIDLSGDGQVNFVVVPAPGCQLKSVTAEPSNYKNLKGPEETESENCYRLTKITGPVTVTAIAVSAACAHEYTTAVTEPTCTQKGCTTHTCTLCGDSYRDSETPALGHSWDNGLVTTEPTEDNAGVRTFTCTRCGETMTETIAPVSHVHSYEASVVSPTCTEGGYTLRLCRCGDSYRDSETPALGHSYADGLCTRCGAGDPNYSPEKKPCDGGQTCPGRNFTDMPATDNWAHEPIDYCIDHSFMNGMSDTSFEPQGTVTRAQLVTILYRVSNAPAAAFRGTFFDVAEGQWYSDAIEWAAANSIVNGKGAGKFDPMGKITREQIAAILYRYSGSPDVEGDLSAFPDSDKASTYAVDALVWAVGEGLINGISSGGVTTLAPQENATRAQIAAIIMRFVEK